MSAGAVTHHPACMWHAGEACDQMCKHGWSVPSPVTNAPAAPAARAEGEDEAEACGVECKAPYWYDRACRAERAAATARRERDEQLELARLTIAERKACEADAQRAIRAYSQRAAAAEAAREAAERERDEWRQRCAEWLAGWDEYSGGYGVDHRVMPVEETRAALAPAPGEATTGEVDRA